MERTKGSEASMIRRVGCQERVGRVKVLVQSGPFTKSGEVGLSVVKGEKEDIENPTSRIRRQVD